MSTKKQQPQPQNDGRLKDPENWTTGDEPMTGAQESYLHTLAQEAGEPVSEDLTKAEASKEIEALQEKTGRGAARSGKRASSGKRRKSTSK